VKAGSGKPLPAEKRFLSRGSAVEESAAQMDLTEGKRRGRYFSKQGTVSTCAVQSTKHELKYTHTHTYTYTHIHTYTHTHIHIHSHTHTHTYTHTYTHTHICSHTQYTIHNTHITYTHMYMHPYQPISTHINPYQP
jgi:hypothetical protein